MIRISADVARHRAGSMRATALLDDAQILHGHSRPQADHLETMSRVEF